MFLDDISLFLLYNFHYFYNSEKNLHIPIIFIFEKIYLQKRKNQRKSNQKEKNQKKINI